MNREEFIKLHPNGEHEALVSEDDEFMECMYCGERKRNGL